jgi:hypothetical protein
MPEENNTKRDAPVALDEGTLLLEQLSSSHEFAAARKTSLNDLTTELRLRVKLPARSPEGYCSAVEVSPYLQRCREVLETILGQQAAGYSYVRWLWYLRRIPPFIFAGNLPTTLVYDSALADAITGLHGKEADTIKVRDVSIRFDLRESVVRRILRFCAGIRILSQFHVLIRFAGKNVQFRFSGNDPIPEAVPTDDQLSAIRLYDERSARDGKPFNRAGTAITTETRAEGGLFVVVYMMRKPELLRVPFGPLTGEHVFIRVLSRFSSALISFDELTRLNSDARLVGLGWWDPEAGLLLLLLRSVISMMAVLTYATSAIFQYGYFVVEEGLLLQVLNERFEFLCEGIADILPNVQIPSNATDLVSSLEQVSGSVWPVRLGPPLRRAGTMLWIDVYGATALLDQMLEFPRGSDRPANVRADHFENSVQALIDTTPWTPPPEVASLRRRRLKYVDEDITDIDAIGAKGDTLILVSCKSLIYSGEYDSGSFTVVRNSASLIGAAVTDWTQKVLFLRSHPIGRNYDLSSYKTFIGVVCTPNVFYVPLGEATAEIAPDLRTAVSIGELRNWLTP